MDITRDLEAMRRRIIQEINTEFDLLIERAAAEAPSPGVPAEEPPYESAFPLTAGSGLFKGTKPTGVIFEDGSRLHASTWKQVVLRIMEHCLAEPENLARLTALSDNISGRKRLLLARSGEAMRSPLPLGEELFMETHYDTETLLNVLTLRILGAIQYDYSGIQVTIRSR